jgi:DNA-3-methyladenine glycosylase II
VLLEVRERQGRCSPVLTVRLRRRGGVPGEPQVVAARRLLTRVLGLDADARGLAALARRDRRLAALARRFAGMRPPRFASVFEAVVNAVACQQLSLDVGVHLLNRLAERFGPRVDLAGSPSGFPAPERLATADPTELRSLGLASMKAATVVSLARRVASGEVDLEGLALVDDEAARALLVSMPGLGRWSAEYVLLRGLGRVHVLPGDDVGARNSLRRHFGLASDAGYAEVADFVAAFWPQAGLVSYLLLLDGLDAAGHVGAGGRTAPARRTADRGTRVLEGGGAVA